MVGKQQEMVPSALLCLVCSFALKKWKVRCLGRFIKRIFNTSWHMLHKFGLLQESNGTSGEGLKKCNENGPRTWWNELRRELGIFHLTTLGETRIWADSITIYKFLGGHNNVNTEQLFKVKRD